MPPDTTPTLRQLAEQVAAMIEPKPIGRPEGDGFNRAFHQLWKWEGVKLVAGFPSQRNRWKLYYGSTDPRFIAKVKAWLWDQGRWFGVAFNSTHVAETNTPSVEVSIYDVDGEIDKVVEVSTESNPADAEARAILSAVVQMENKL